jgi:hypothetical protein
MASRDEEASSPKAAPKAAAKPRAVSVVGKQLLRIEELAEKKAEQLEAANYDKYSVLFDIAIAYFKKKPVLLYGGTAINDLLPDRLKFYGEKVLPDLDVFVNEENVEAIAQGLVNEYTAKGYNLAAYKPALHENTLKVYAQGVQVADVSGVPRKAYATLKKGSVRSSFGIPIVNTAFLRWSLHSMLAQPYDSHRWKKVYERIVAFYQIYPPAACDAASAIAVPAAGLGISEAERAVADDIHAGIAGFVKSNGLVMFGFDAVRLFLPEQFRKDAVASTAQPMFNLLVSEEPRATAYELVKALRSRAKEALAGAPRGSLSDPAIFRVSAVYPGDAFVPDHVVVYYKKRAIAALYHSETCMSFVPVSGFRIASLQTMLRMYMSLMLSAHDHHKKEKPACVANALAWLHLKLVKSPSRRKLLEQFVLTCYGEGVGRFTMRRRMLERAAFAAAEADGHAPAQGRLAPPPSLASS